MMNNLNKTFSVKVASELKIGLLNQMSEWALILAAIFAEKRLSMPIGQGIIFLTFPFHFRQ